jgi:hypothetical protein
MQEEIKAVSSAVEEVAKAGSKSMEVLQEFGGFISEFTRAPLSAATGILADKLNYMRWENQQRLILRSREFLRQTGRSTPAQAVPMNFAIPLLEAASLEENNDLQDLWAILLVNAATSDRPNDRRRAYISILEQLTHLDAQILIKIYSLLEGNLSEKAAVTEHLPESATVFPEGGKFEDLRLPSAEIILSLANLVRIGCLDANETWGGQKDYRTAHGTILGRAFFDAVTLRHP